MRIAHRKQAGPASEKGAAALEFALALPMLCLLLVGMVNVGLVLNSNLVIANAARDAARFAARTNATDTAVRSMVAQSTTKLRSTLPTACAAAGAPGVCVTRSTTGGVSSLTVAVCYDQPLPMAVPGVMSKAFRMCAKTTMRTA